MYILQGNEMLEQLMIWLKNYNDKINKNVSLTAPEKLTIPKQIDNKEAQTIVSANDIVVRILDTSWNLIIK